MSIWWPRFDDIQAWLVSRGYTSRDWGLLAACLDRPLATLAGQEIYPTIWLKAAALLDSVERNHPLIDGNNRLGFLLASLVLNSNGVSCQRVSDDQWYELIIAVASDRLQANEIADLLQTMLSAGWQSMESSESENLARAIQGLRPQEKVPDSDSAELLI